MRIGVFVGASAADLMSLDALLARIKQAEDDGFDSFWVPHISARGYDALTVLALAGAQTSRIELGVGVVPTYPRHPVALAQQALTTAAASNSRFILGIGPSHRPGIEESFGLSYDSPAQHTREYLSVLRPLIDEGRVQFSGRFYNVSAELGRARPSDLPGGDLSPRAAHAAPRRPAGRRHHHLDGRPPRHPRARAAPHQRRRRSLRTARSLASASACPQPSATTRPWDAAPPPSPTSATAAWSTTAASSTWRMSRARPRSRW